MVCIVPLRGTLWSATSKPVVETTKNAVTMATTVKPKIFLVSNLYTKEKYAILIVNKHYLHIAQHNYKLKKKNLLSFSYLNGKYLVKIYYSFIEY